MVRYNRTDTKRSKKRKRGEKVNAENVCTMPDIDSKNNYEDFYELCVCCHKKINISKAVDIEFRPFYIEGAGQLCYDCFHELYRS